MKHTFNIIAKKFRHQSDGRIARDHYGNAKTMHITIPFEAETLQEAWLLGEDIINDIGHDWLETRVCSEAERMWANGNPALFNLDSFNDVGRLKEAS